MILKLSATCANFAQVQINFSRFLNTPNVEETIERKYYITKVPVMAVSRYLKTCSNIKEKAAKSFVLDCICAESKELLMSDLERYPLLALSITEKILTSQGFSKTTVLKKLA